MPEFASLRSYQQFEQNVKTKARFVPDDIVRGFLQTVVETVERSRLKLLPKDYKRLFRAQLGCTREPSSLDDNQPIDWCEVAFPFDRMVPKAEYVGDGRVNPRGIPCLYLANTASAAISEMRPWIGSYITLALFQTVRDCRLVDCTHTTPSVLLEPVFPDGASEPDAATRENGVWGDIGFAFSKPVTHDEPHLDYVPTQILAEIFRHHGYHGIVYKSLLDKGGENIALFDPEAAKPISRCLYTIKAASLNSAKLETVEPYSSFWPDSISSALQQIELY
jgi:RES domain-containing protein